MSSNNIISPKQYTNCLRREGKLDIQNLNRLNEDNCEKLFSTHQSESPGIYHLTQYRDCQLVFQT